MTTQNGKIAGTKGRVHSCSFSSSKRSFELFTFIKVAVIITALISFYIFDAGPRPPSNSPFRRLQPEDHHNDNSFRGGKQGIHQSVHFVNATLKPFRSLPQTFTVAIPSTIAAPTSSPSTAPSRAPSTAPSSVPSRVRSLSILRPSPSPSSAPRTSAMPETSIPTTTTTLNDLPGEDVVLGIAFNVSLRNLAVFCISFRRVAPQNKVVLFLQAPISKDVRMLLDVTHVSFVVINGKSFGDPKTVGSKNSSTTAAVKSSLRGGEDALFAPRLPAYARTYHPSTLRWPLVRMFLDEMRSRGEIVRRVLLIDARDSYFQSNPFALVPLLARVDSNGKVICHQPTRNDLRPTDHQQQQEHQRSTRTNEEQSRNVPASVEARAPQNGSSETNRYRRHSLHHTSCIPIPTVRTFRESEYLSIQDCQWNSQWIKDCFDEELYDEVADKPIINSGVVIGTADAIYDYAVIMEDVVLGLNKTTWSTHAHTRFPSCERNGVDQGVHNVLVHTHALGNDTIRISSQLDGPVAHMQSGHAQVLGGPHPDPLFVVNPAMKKVAIVHQYDRNKKLEDFIFSTNAFRSSWTGDEIVRLKRNYPLFDFKQDVDAFKGLCDLDVSEASDPGRCCELCVTRHRPICRSFTWANNLCFFKRCKTFPNATSSSSSPVVQIGAVSAVLLAQAH